METWANRPSEIRVLWVGQTSTLQARIHATLRARGWSLVVCRAGREAMDCVLNTEADLLLLDVDADALDPWGLLAELRQWQSTPVIALADEPGRSIDAFRRGADDFVAKSADPLELLLRGQALLRRTRQLMPADPGGERLVVGPLSLSREDASVRYDNRPLRVTAIQFKLLWCLAEHHNTLLKKSELHRWVLNKSYCRDDRSIDMHLSRVRRKLIAAGMPPDAVQTVRGRGYRLSLLSRSAPVRADRTVQG